jgi:hypothetical protein
MVSVPRTGLGSASTAVRPGSIDPMPAFVPALAALGVVLVVAVLVATTPIGSGDYGQWLMVSRAFSGESTPEYRALADVPPLVPALIAGFHALLGSPIAALHATGFVLVLALGLGFFAAATAIDGRPVTGLAAAILGLLVADSFLDLMAFGGLLQAAATALLMLAVAAFSRALRGRAAERRWWLAGAVALFATCLAHVPSATVALPVCLAAAGLSALPSPGERPSGRLRDIVPLVAMFGLIGGYWLLSIVPASLGYVANPASLAYRGPERVFQLIADFPPTAAICVIGGLGVAGWAAGHLVAARLPDRRDARIVLLAWLVVAWGAFGASAVSGASTDYPRFVPLLVAPLVVAAAVALRTVGTVIRRRARRHTSAEQGLTALGLSIAIVAPFSIARYQTEAVGYQLTDEPSLQAAATWADAHLVAGASILAPVREAKWIEGLTGRSTLFSSQVRYAFRPQEWERSLAADALLRGNLALANESFVLTLTDGVATADGQEPRSLLIAANHGGEYVDLLRTVPASGVILDDAGTTLASLPAMEPAGLLQSAGTDELSASITWTGVRRGSQVDLAQRVALERGAASFTLEEQVSTGLAVGGVRLELRPPSGVAVVDVAGSGDSAEVSFARIGRSEPRLRLRVPGGSVVGTADGGIALSAPGSTLSLEVTALTAGGASTSLRLLDPADLAGTYDVGAVILRRDPTYDARRARLELLGFHVADAEGPYIVMIRSAAVLRAGP